MTTIYTVFLAVELAGHMLLCLASSLAVVVRQVGRHTGKLADQNSGLVDFVVDDIIVVVATLSNIQCLGIFLFLTLDLKIDALRLLRKSDFCCV